VLSTILLGYFLGSVVPNIDKYITGIVILIIVVSSLPAFIHFWKDNKDEIVLKLRSIIGKK
jgi:membrane-associated protein